MQRQVLRWPCLATTLLRKLQTVSKPSKASAVKVKANNASAVHATVMAVIAESVVASVAVSARSKAIKMHRKASFLSKTSQ